MHIPHACHLTYGLTLTTFLSTNGSKSWDVFVHLPLLSYLLFFSNSLTIIHLPTTTYNNLEGHHRNFPSIMKKITTLILTLLECDIYVAANVA